MNCPVCKKAMIVLELDRVEIDYCIACGGIWLDAGELELLLGSSSAKDNVLKSFIPDVKTKEKKVKCPICLKKMAKVSYGKENKVIIDKCPNNDGLWFDKGELYQIIKMGGLGGNDEVTKMLKDMLGAHLSEVDTKEVR